MLVELNVQSSTQAELIDITDRIQQSVSQSGVSKGICHVFVPHTTAGVTVNENWDPTVRQDILHALDRIVPEDGGYRHAEGNSPAHIKTALTGSSITLLLEDSGLVLGTWQGVYLAEFDGPRRRRVLVKIIAE